MLLRVRWISRSDAVGFLSGKVGVRYIDESMSLPGKLQGRNLDSSHLSPVS